MFQRNPLTTYWKIALTASTLTDDNALLNGTNEIILKTNQAPYNGTCLVDIFDGIALETNFTVECSNWIDADGFIFIYEFYGI